MNYESSLFLINFQNIVLFQVELRVGIYNDLLGDHFLKAEDQMIFFSVKQLCNFRIDSDHDLDAIKYPVFAEYLPENIMADGLAGH